MTNSRYRLIMVSILAIVAVFLFIQLAFAKDLTRVEMQAQLIEWVLKAEFDNEDQLITKIMKASGRRLEMAYSMAKDAVDRLQIAECSEQVIDEFGEGNFQAFLNQTTGLFESFGTPAQNFAFKKCVLTGGVK